MSRFKTTYSKIRQRPIGFFYFIISSEDVVNDGTNGHYMLFYINVQNKTKFPYTRAVDGVQVATQKIKSVKKRTDNIGFGDGQIDPGLAKAAGIKPTYEFEEEYNRRWCCCFNYEAPDVSGNKTVIN